MQTQAVHARIPAFIAVVILGFLFGFLLTVVITHWNTINTLFYEGSLAKYEVMSGQRGPVTYLIFHDDFAALQAMADQHEDILGVEHSVGSNVAKMAFASAQSPLIETVNKHAAVASMISRNVTMICH